MPMGCAGPEAAGGRRPAGRSPTRRPFSGPGDGGAPCAHAVSFSPMMPAPISAMQAIFCGVTASP